MMPSEFSLPFGVSLVDLLAQVRKLSWGAADILLAYSRGKQPPYGFQKALEVKDGGDGPVSAADLAVNKWLLDGLNESFPLVDWMLLSEETAKDNLKQGEPLPSEWLWILDPLDGTKDFLQGTGDYAVHLALVRSGRPVFGVILIPELNELWLGVEGVGAWCEDRNEKRSSVCFSQTSQLSELRLVASRNHRDSRLEKLVEKLALGSEKSVGSVGCKIASILRGETDVYISLSGKTSPKDWDMAAPEAVLMAAGGEFTHADNKSLLYNTGDIRQSGCLIASHGLCHGELCEAAAKIMNSLEPDFRL